MGVPAAARRADRRGLARLRGYPAQFRSIRSRGAFVPVGRTYDPVTGRDWETVGVAPDVAVPPEQALTWVLTDLGLDAAKAQELSASHAPTLPMQRRKT